MANSKNKKYSSKKQKNAPKRPQESAKSKTKAKVSVKKTSAKIKQTAKKKSVKSPVRKLKTSAQKPAKTKESFKKETQKRLLNAKNEILADVSQKVREESNPTKFEIGDIYDIASIERDRELSLILGDRDREKLAGIEDALERLKEGTYGLCDECGEPIGEERLKILPFTKVCVECKSKNEREHGTRKKYEEEAGLGIIEKTETEEEF